MSNEILATLENNIDGFTIRFDFIAIYDGYLGQSNFDNQWERASSHQGGVTINHDGEHWIPLNYSLSQLSKDYAKQGRENPSGEAYKSLLEQFERDKDAFEAVLEVTVLKNDIELFQDNIVGTDYNHTDYNYDHDKVLESLLEYAEKDSVYIEKAKETLKGLLGL